MSNEESSYGGQSSGQSGRGGSHHAVRLPSRRFSGEALIALGIVSITIGGIVTVLNEPLGYALMFLGALLGGAGMLR